MRQSKFTETQSVSNLKEAVAGRPVNEIWLLYGISSATYYKWKAKCGGLEASDVKRLRELEHENGRLKRMYADETGHVLSVPHRLGSTGCPGHRGLHDPASGQKSLGLLEVL